MRIDRSLLNWGVFLIALGGIPLAVRSGLARLGHRPRAGPAVAVDPGRHRPGSDPALDAVRLVRRRAGGGHLRHHLRRGRGSLPDDDIGNLQGVIPALVGGACNRDDAGPARTAQGSVANPEAFELSISLACGGLSVSRAAETNWDLQARHALDDAPSIRQRDLDGATSYLGLAQESGGDLAFLGRQQASDWNVLVPASAALTVGATLDGVKADLRLGLGPLTRVSATLNASEVAIDLSGASTPSRPRWR